MTGMSTPDGLADAIARGDADAVRAIIAPDPARAMSKGAQGVSALLLTVYHGQPALAALLRPHLVPDVHEAAALGEVARLSEILAADPARVHDRSADGWTPLHLAAFFADAPTVAALLAAGADVAARSTNATDNAPLHAAIAGRRDIEAIRRLVEAGADVNARAGGGWTPLHLAASRGDVALVDYLLARGADRTARADDDRDAVAIAEAYGHPDAAARLRPTA
ncbi:MAG TPA: ankyrin repeat domain-containing protein [Gemmatimonadaceae bacterium]|nr:ankyrin repeat domain-containing protein [Gemmatimonadaceae bacterium]